MLVKFEIYNDDENVPYLKKIEIDKIPNDHVAFGWIECIYQSDLCPSWTPKFFKMNYV